MIEFWLLSTLLLLPLMVFVLWPLVRKRHHKAPVLAIQSAQAALYREHLEELEAVRTSGAVGIAQYRALQAELARNLLSGDGQSFQLQAERRGGRGFLIGLALALPLLAAALYFYRGAHEDVALQQLIAASQQGNASQVVESKITAALRARVRLSPQDLTSRYVLAQRLLNEGDLGAAVNEYQYIIARDPGATNVRAELAQALFFAAGAQMTVEVRDQIDAVFEREPENSIALGLAGIAAFNDKRYADARDFWLRALAQQPTSSSAIQALSAGVARAEEGLAQLRGDTGLATAAPEVELFTGGQASNVKPEKATGNTIEVQVTLAEAVSAAAETPVFVYARSSDSPMPLAIVRLTAAELPARVVLNESRAMVPGYNLKSVDSVQLVARLAVHGDVRPTAGDWQGEVAPFVRAQWGKPVEIIIDRQL
ncbi:MAG: c-type cytochrome biogenesis protein CcmI [Gammaproteobacteria bacterium]|nr:c-type cytochrome biogenesis protein CcmI [Gammaproteobacteria bacterium]